MIERLVENWLINASERTFQLPFCHILASKGYTVLHLTRHCGMELGKDVVALDPSGTPCAFQLKSPQGLRITLTDWREISKQVHDMVTTKLVHPSIPTSTTHRSFLVTNKGIDEEVVRAIQDMNQHWADLDLPYSLETIVGGELRKDAQELGTNLWPTELTQIKTLLEMLLEEGTGPLDCDKLSQLLLDVFPLGDEKPSGNEVKRAISSAGILCALAVSSFSAKSNHVAQFDAWMLYLGHFLATVEKWRIPAKEWEADFLWLKSNIVNVLENLVEELRERPNLIEGDPIHDAPFRRIRVTRLLGLICILAHWTRHRADRDDIREFVIEFSSKNQAQLNLWGEGAVPLFLGYFWFIRTVDATLASDGFLYSMLNAVCLANGPKSTARTSLASPYHSESRVVASRLGITPDDGEEEDFRGHSYTLESIVHLFARQNWKQRLHSAWPDVTRISFNRFDPSSKWRFLLWRVDKGTNVIEMPKWPKSWQELRNEAAESRGRCIPNTLKRDPHLLALFLCVHPHRLNAEVARWLDSQFLSMDSF